MSEPESLATEEALDTHIRRHAYDRLLMLSDGIFAIAITLAALEIKTPELAQGLTKATLRPIVVYLVSFGLIASFWLSHRDLFARLRRVDSVVTGLTLALLCFVSLIPVTIGGVMGSGDLVFRFYTLTMIGAGIANAAMWSYSALRPGIMRDEVPGGYRWTRAISTWTLPAIFLPALWTAVDDIPSVLLPVAAAAILLRRVILPRLFRAKA